MGIQGTPNMGMVIFAEAGVDYVMLETYKKLVDFLGLIHHRRICRAPFWHFKAKASGFLLDWLRV